MENLDFLIYLAIILFSVGGRIYKWINDQKNESEKAPRKPRPQSSGSERSQAPQERPNEPKPIEELKWEDIFEDITESHKPESTYQTQSAEADVETTPTVKETLNKSANKAPRQKYSEMNLENDSSQYDLDFDPVKAVIFSEILKRPEW